MKKNSSNGMQPVPSFSGWMDNFFQDNLNRFFEDELWYGRDRLNPVPVNIRQTDKSYELELAAPGLKKEDFKISINGDRLTVSFEHKEDRNEQNKEEGWIRKEYKRRSFSRSFNLDDSVDAHNINAAYRDGILHLSIPKKEGAQSLSRTIEVK